MTTLSERIQGERMRLREVRQALTAATRPGAGGDASRAPFYIAVGDYFEAAMARLHEQDIRMGNLLREKADMDDPDNQKAMRELDERLAGNQRHLKKMLAARDRLRAGEDGALEEFEAAGGAYADYIVQNMGHHPGSTDMAAKHFAPEDWEFMAFASDEAQAREKELHAKVFAAAPKDLDIEG